MKGFSHKDRFEPEDYYINEDGFFVMTEKYHLKRGYCCKSGCKHCPYGYGPAGLKRDMENKRRENNDPGGSV